MSTDAHRLSGIASMVLTVCMWAGFALSLRAITTSGLTAGEVAAIRFGVPLLVLAPWIPRSLRRLRSAPPLAVGAIVVGAGLPYFLVSSWGSSLTSATLTGVIIPGTSPLFVALMGLIVLRERGRPRVLIPLIPIVLGVGLLVADSWRPGGSLAGVALLVGAGWIWAVYTLGLRRAGLDPVSATVILCLPNLLLACTGMAVGVLPHNAGVVPVGSVLVFVLVQGVGVGVIASLAYAVAVRRIGANSSAAIGAASPLLVALAAIPLFGEVPTLLVAGGGAMIVAGVLLATLLSDPAARPRKGPHHAVRYRLASTRSAVGFDNGLPRRHQRRQG